jgi:squalene-associated FAD-dependent desaturase
MARVENRDLRMTRVAVIGAGWAGAAAALTLARGGVQVVVFEATKTVGGRARFINKDGRRFDNGQHLLLGAYERSLALIGSLHDAIDDAILRVPLRLRTAPGVEPRMRLQAPNVAAPLNLLLAIATAGGLSVKDKFSTLIWAAHHLRRRVIFGTATVSEIIAGQPESARRLLWEPLCVAALNTLPDVASGRVFIEVLQRAFTGDRRASDLIIPRVDLSLLLPEPALAEVVTRGGTIRLASPVLTINQNDLTVNVVSRDETLEFDRVVIATGPQHVSRLLNDEPTTLGIAHALRELKYEPITTLHFEFGWVVPSVATGMLMLDAAPGQWLFWQQLPNGHWRASVVISAHHRTQSETELTAASLAQLRLSYQLPAPTWHIVVTEKRATYACTPEQTCILSELPKRIGRLLFAGDWCYPELPATLEAAVIAGEDAARSILGGTARE